MEEEWRCSYCEGEKDKMCCVGFGQYFMEGSFTRG